MVPTLQGVTVLLEIFDMPTSIAFYRALGFEVVQHWPRDDEFDWAPLRLGGAELMLNTAYERDERPPTPDSGRVSGHADTELYFECTDVDEVCEILRRKGIAVNEPETTFFGTKRVCLSDPDGFKVWFQSPVSPN
jgi:glyoxylase I family protein